MLQHGQFVFDGSHVNLLIAFFAGFITFFASCLLPLVPTYLAYLSGVSLNGGETEAEKWRIFKTALTFVIGFILTFVLLGMTLSGLSAFIAPFRIWIQRLSGLVFITLGLFMLGIFRHRWFTEERKFHFDGFFTENTYLHALVVGIAFGFAWTPCIGPVLAVILFWSTQQASAIFGTLLLLVYGLGLGLPFILVALAFEKVVPWLKKYNAISKYVNYFAAGVIILAGVLLLVGQFNYLSMVLLEIFDINVFAA